MPVVRFTRLVPRSTRRAAVRAAAAAVVRAAAALGALAASAACRAGSEHPPGALRDDFGDTVRVGAPPQRIVSLNPTTTELAFALGAGRRLVGRTHWDVYPDSARLVPDLGPGLRPNVEAVLAAKPDLVLLYASADNRGAAATLRQAGIATISLKIDRIEDFRRAVRLLGSVLGDTARAHTLADTVSRTLERVRTATRSAPRPRVFWQVWNAPLITIGRGSFMSELVELAGGRNVYGDIAAPSPQVALEDVARRDPDVVLVGPEGAAQMRSDVRWRALRAVREGRILVVDTTLVWRPSLRTGEAAVSMARLLHPELGL
jgi:ABC-type Fe3+-hydroxamate transport system substrate-binding protein